VEWEIISHPHPCLKKKEKKEKEREIENMEERNLGFIC
jgi:hypothetical protein